MYKEDIVSLLFICFYFLSKRNKDISSESELSIILFPGSSSFNHLPRHKEKSLDSSDTAKNSSTFLLESQFITNIYASLLIYIYIYIYKREREKERERLEKYG